MSLGPFTFTLQSVFISVVSTAIVFPVNFVVIFIFRRTRPKDNRLHQSNQTQSSKYGWRSITGMRSHSCIINYIVCMVSKTSLRSMLKCRFLTVGEKEDVKKPEI